MSVPSDLDTMDLPDDVWIEILRMLPMSSVMSLFLVSKEWSETTSQCVLHVPEEVPINIVGRFLNIRTVGGLVVRTSEDLELLTSVIPSLLQGDLTVRVKTGGPVPILRFLAERKRTHPLFRTTFHVGSDGERMEWDGKKSHLTILYWRKYDDMVLGTKRAVDSVLVSLWEDIRKVTWDFPLRDWFPNFTRKVRCSPYPSRITMNSRCGNADMSLINLLGEIPCVSVRQFSLKDSRIVSNIAILSSVLERHRVHRIKGLVLHSSHISKAHKLFPLATSVTILLGTRKDRKLVANSHHLQLPHDKIITKFYRDYPWLLVTMYE